VKASAHSSHREVVHNILEQGTAKRGLQKSPLAVMLSWGRNWHFSTKITRCFPNRRTELWVANLWKSHAWFRVDGKDVVYNAVIYQMFHVLFSVEWILKIAW